MKKLVRDKVPEIMEAQGKKFGCRTAADDEYRRMLIMKIKEEATEVEYDGAKELADVLEAAMCLAESYGVAWQEIERMAAEKRAEKGSFRKKIVMETKLLEKV